MTNINRSNGVVDQDRLIGVTCSRIFIFVHSKRVLSVCMSSSHIYIARPKVCQMKKGSMIVATGELLWNMQNVPERTATGRKDIAFMLAMSGNGFVVWRAENGRDVADNRKH